ncbi:MAG: AMP-binding protein [Gordonia sp. (in: high G+C Gram-positive bacteria)]|uniref:AMP-binding protein n=1 Tax=Gordonia sp. (in: high G+C Gram-positive bacteria) TaxID=84139 RepID=UPI0039E5F35C
MRGPGIVGGPADPVWTPPDEVVGRSRLLAAMRTWGYDSLADVHRALVDEPERFWRDAVRDLDIEFETPFERVLDDGDGKPFPKWFVGGRINLATLCSARHAAGPRADKTALIYEGDGGRRRELTYAELDARVQCLAANLAALGVRRGDRVVLFLPIVPEAAIAYLACAMLGAVSVPAFSGYGADAVATRLVDSGATVLITADGSTRRGRTVPMKETADEAMDLAGGIVKTCIVVRNVGNDVATTAGRDVYHDELDPHPAPVETASTESNDPVTIVYTSGTTGRPKGIVHSHGGFAVKAAVDFAYGFDIHDDDVVAWIADMGWLLGPLLISAVLQLGATLVLTEGVPTYPTPNRLWEIAERNGVTFQGIAPTAARALKAAGDDPGADLSTVRTFASTGEAWDEPTWHWLFDTIGEGRRPVVNYSGGTEIGGGIAVSYPFLPMEPASFNAPMLGIDLAVLNDDAEPVIGEVGEICVLNTSPGMTHSFWKDRERYLETYWSRWDGVWVHGDLASVDARGTWRIHGRSDDTLKVSGRRVGPGEIEASMLVDRRIVEAAVIGVPDEQRGQRVVGFVVPADPDAVHADIAAEAERNVGRAFAPTVHVVASLPKTKNGKVMRRALRARYLGRDPGDLSSLDPATPLEAIPRGPVAP